MAVPMAKIRFRRLAFFWRITALAALAASTGGLAVGSQTAPAHATNSATYQYLIGSGFICSAGPFCPEVSMAPNGDTLTVTGDGTFSLDPRSATGGGTFIHKNSEGDTLATGTWTAAGLLSFKSFGISPELEEVLPEGSTGGQVILRVHISPDAGGPGFDALMTVICDLDSNPPGRPEVLRLVAPGINFKEHVSGGNIFVKQ